MNLEHVPSVKGIEGGPSVTGESIIIELKLTDNSTTKFSIPLVDLSRVLIYFLVEAKRASERCDVEKLIKDAEQFAETAEVGVSQISLGPSSKAVNSVLELWVGHIALRFELPNSALRALAQKIINMSNTKIMTEK